MNQEEFELLVSLLASKEKEFKEIQKSSPKDSEQYWKNRADELEKILLQIFQATQNLNKENTKDSKEDKKKVNKLAFLPSIQFQGNESSTERSSGIAKLVPSRGAKTHRERSSSSLPPPNKKEKEPAQVSNKSQSTGMPISNETRDSTKKKKQEDIQPVTFDEKTFSSPRDTVRTIDKDSRSNSSGGALKSTQKKENQSHNSALEHFQNLEILSDIQRVTENNKMHSLHAKRVRSNSFNPRTNALTSSNTPKFNNESERNAFFESSSPRKHGGQFPDEKTVGKSKFQKKTTSRMNLNCGITLNLPPVVLPIESSAFLVEAPKETKDLEVNLLYIPDYYQENYLGNKHFNWISCEENQTISIFSLADKPDENNNKLFKGLINNKKGFRLIDLVVTETGNFDFTSRAIQLEKCLKNQYPKTFFSRVKGTECDNAIANIEKQFRQEQAIFKVSVVYCKGNQVDPLEMFKNVEHSENFEKFLKIMEVPTHESSCLTELISWKDKKVGYLLATKLNSEQHRRLIGNTQAVIFFKEDPGPFNPEGVDAMGIVPQFYAVVQPHEGQYRIGFFYRVNMKIVEPIVPSNALFDLETMKDFLLTKIHNGYMVAKQVPPINRLFEMPRQQAINNIAYLYSPKQWLKKIAPTVYEQCENESNS